VAGQATSLDCYERKHIYKKLSKFSEFYVGFAGDGPNLNHLYHFFRSGYDYYWISGNLHRFQWSNGALGPISNGIGDVYGCGLLLSPENKLAIFFTGNGVLLGAWQFIIYLNGIPK
jgi:hypothetical protein